MIVVRATFIRSPRIAIKLEDFLRAIDTLLSLCLAFLVLLLVSSFKHESFAAKATCALLSPLHCQQRIISNEIRATSLVAARTRIRYF